MVDDPAATDDESQNKKSGSNAEIAQAVVDGVNLLAGPRSTASVPSIGAASGETVAGGAEAAEASAAVVDVAAAAGDAADTAVSVAGSVFGILDGL